MCILHSDEDEQEEFESDTGQKQNDDGYGNVFESLEEHGEESNDCAGDFLERPFIIIVLRSEQSLQGSRAVCFSCRSSLVFVVVRYIHGIFPPFIEVFYNY